MDIVVCIQQSGSTATIADPAQNAKRPRPVLADALLSGRLCGSGHAAAGRDSAENIRPRRLPSRASRQATEAGKNSLPATAQGGRAAPPVDFRGHTQSRSSSAQALLSSRARNSSSPPKDQHCLLPSPSVPQTLVRACSTAPGPSGTGSSRPLPHRRPNAANALSGLAPGVPRRWSTRITALATVVKCTAHGCRAGTTASPGAKSAGAADVAAGPACRRRSAWRRGAPGAAFSASLAWSWPAFRTLNLNLERALKLSSWTLNLYASGCSSCFGDGGQFGGFHACLDLRDVRGHRPRHRLLKNR